MGEKMGIGRGGSLVPAMTTSFSEWQERGRGFGQLKRVNKVLVSLVPICTMMVFTAGCAAMICSFFFFYMSETISLGKQSNLVFLVHMLLPSFTAPSLGFPVAFNFVIYSQSFVLCEDERLSRSSDQWSKSVLQLYTCLLGRFVVSSPFRRCPQLCPTTNKG